MSAKAYYVVRISVGISKWLGEWDNKEAQYEDQSTVLCESDSLEFAEQFYKNRGGKLRAGEKP
jgi:hypothetical protein